MKLLYFILLSILFKSYALYPLDCSVSGLFCVDDGQHDYQYYECSGNYQGFRSCAPGTKCAGAQNNPYDYNPCIEYPTTVSESEQIHSSSSKSMSSEQQQNESSQQPITPSIGTPSSEQPVDSTESDSALCKEDGFFCVDDGLHDYEYLECSGGYKGFRPCAAGTKCAGSTNNPYTYNPCIAYPINQTSEQNSSESSTKPVSSEVPTTPSVAIPSSEQQQSNVPTDCSVDGFFCVDDGQHDYQYLECSINYKGFRPCAAGTKCAGSNNNPYTYNPCISYPFNQTSEQPSQSSSTSNSSEQPITPSIAIPSSEQQQSTSSNVPTDCSVDGFFCVDDGLHDYQYLECSSGYKGFRPCAAGTKCAGSNNNPYTYNPCISYPINQTSEQNSSESSTKPVSSEQPTTPSVAIPSSEQQQSTSSNVPTDCSIDGFFCVDDGLHDYEYLECNEGYKGFRPCAAGTKCSGAQNNPYTYNPCISYPFNQTSEQNSSDSSSQSQSSEQPTTPSVAIPSSEQQQSNVPTDCSIDGFFCVDDGQHDYQYLECSINYKGFRPCAPGTKCAGAQNNPYTYNPCIAYPTNSTSEQNSSESSSTSNSSEVPITPSIGTPSSEQQQSTSSQVPTDCSVDGFFCVDDGLHDYQYLECSGGYKGFRPCAPGTKCSGAQNNPYTYNPCVYYPTNSSSEQPSQSSSQSKQESSEQPITPSIGTLSSEESSTHSTVPTDCSVDGFFCVDDGLHDYQYLECNEGYKGFRPCAPGTKCAGSNNNPYTYNPCVYYPMNSTSEQNSSESSTTSNSSEQPITPSIGTLSSEESSTHSTVPTDCSVDGFFCVDDGQHDYEYLECSSGYKGFRPCAPGTKCSGAQNNPYTYNPCIAYYPYNPNTESSESSKIPSQSSTIPQNSSEIPTTPSVGTPSSEQHQSTVPTDCSVDGFFCVDDGLHDYQYLECSSGYKGFRPCAAGTKCAGSNNNPYTYNPCIAYPYNPKPQSSEQPSQSSSTSKPVSSEQPTTPSVATPSSEQHQSTSSQVPTDCSIDGFFCVDDGQHDYQYLECSGGYKGFRPCAPGTKCSGAQNNPYTYNPCIAYYPYNPNTESSESSKIPSQSSSQSKPVSSEQPTTPSVAIPSSEQHQSTSSQVPTDCSVDGFFCVDDGQHDYQYLECSINYKGFRPCAAGTKCAGSNNNPYTYNPCISYPFNQTSEQPSQSSSQSSEQPTTPSVAIPSSEQQSTTPESQSSICKEDGFFCVMDGQHDYEYLECSSGYKGFRPCAPGTRCAGDQDEPYKFNPCVIYDNNQSSTIPQKSSEQPTTPSVAIPSSEQSSTIPSTTPSEEEYQSCGDFECQEDGLYCQIDGQRNNRYCECATTFKGSRPCAKGTWCQGEQDKPYDYNPCVFIDQTSWFGNVTYPLPKN